MIKHTLTFFLCTSIPAHRACRISISLLLAVILPIGFPLGGEIPARTRIPEILFCVLAYKKCFLQEQQWVVPTHILNQSWNWLVALKLLRSCCWYLLCVFYTFSSWVVYPFHECLGSVRRCYGAARRWRRRWQHLFSGRTQ